MFEVTPNKLGTFIGECAELCGVDHSRMLFNVKVVTPEHYQAHIKDLAAKGQTGYLPAGIAHDGQRRRTAEPHDHMSIVNEPQGRRGGTTTRYADEPPVTRASSRADLSSSGSPPPTTRPSAPCT